MPLQASPPPHEAKGLLFALPPVACMGQKHVCTRRACKFNSEKPSMRTSKLQAAFSASRAAVSFGAAKPAQRKVPAAELLDMGVCGSQR